MIYVPLVWFEPNNAALQAKRDELRSLVDKRRKLNQRLHSRNRLIAIAALIVLGPIVFLIQPGAGIALWLLYALPYYPVILVRRARIQRKIGQLSVAIFIKNEYGLAMAEDTFAWRELAAALQTFKGDLRIIIGTTASRDKITPILLAYLETTKMARQRLAVRTTPPANDNPSLAHLQNAAHQAASAIDLVVGMSSS